jgi:hypothetical protein
VRTSCINGARVDLRLHQYLNEDNAMDSEKIPLEMVEDLKVKVCKVLSREQSIKFLKSEENY